MARAPDRGAAAVEFALITPILLLLLFGIIDFGIWLGDAINGRQGVREAARQGVVEDFTSPGCGGSDMSALACTAKARVGSFAGLSNSYAKVQVLDDTGASTSTWQRGNSLLVCVDIQANGLTGLTPLPRGGWIRSEVVMRIEQPLTTTTTVDRAGVADALPAGEDWSWCDGT